MLTAITLFLGAFSLLYLHPPLQSDSTSYIQAMGILAGNPLPADFVPTRILATTGGLSLVLLLGHFFGILNAWILMNFIFFIVIALASFFLLRTIFESERVAFLGALFIVGNYGPIVFGLNYLMDAGGWAFYLLALWGVARYVQTRSASAILWASAAVGIGGLLKEYALLGCIAIAVALIWSFFREPRRASYLALATAVIAILPVALVHTVVYMKFGYTYLDWVQYNKQTYVYASRIVEYVKAIGWLINILAPFAIAGAWIWGRSIVKSGRAFLETPRNIAVIAVVLSAMPVFAWAGITERVLFVLVPAAALFACFLFERYERIWYVFLAPLALYLVASVSMDTLIKFHRVFLHLPL